jgi:hypothetical protein
MLVRAASAGRVACLSGSASALPPPHRLQLLRGLSQLRQEAGDPPVGTACNALRAMCAADGQGDLPGVLRLPCDRLHQQRRAGNRLGPVIELGQTDG